MLDRITKSVNYAMLPIGIIMLLTLIVIIAIGFVTIIVTHVVAFESMFPAVSQYVYSNGAMNQVSFSPSPTLYPLFLCLFIDASVLLGICGFFKINLSTALIVVFFILFAPITIPILIIMFFISKCNNTVSSTSSKNYSVPKYSKSNHSDLADKF